ncbi:MAG: beta-glucosidase [Mariniphaga sp.]|nr:beta-glucosidase [Mariniphaga sp.]
MKHFFKYLVTCFLAVVFLFVSCTKENKTGENELSEFLSESEMSNDSLLTLIQQQTFNYFWEGGEPSSGLACERIHMDNIYPDNDQTVVTTGGTGFGLMALLVGIERNFITRKEGFQRFDKIVSFLEIADRFHGAWPHWLYGETGKTKPFSEKDNGGDLVETAFLVQGLLAVRQYFANGNTEEKQLSAKIDQLWQEVEWNWYTQNGKNILFWHWSPDYGWEMNFGVKGYNECLIMYILAASSPTYSINPEVYHEGWARGGDIKTTRTFNGLNLVLDHYDSNDSPVGPLFWAHYSYLGLDSRNLEDLYGNYWELNKNHALINYQYCVENPKGFKDYGENCWGLTSSYSINFYDAHRPDNDTGVISPTAALSSYPYVSEESIKMMRYLYAPANKDLIGKYGPYDAFSREHNWSVQRYLAIDQGPIPVMIENGRTGLLWNLFMSCPEIEEGLEKLGFTNW